MRLICIRSSIDPKFVGLVVNTYKGPLYFDRNAIARLKKLKLVYFGDWKFY
jgi:hypothetical protein